MNDKLSHTYIPHLAGQFQTATPVLFTGAGFSLGALNTAGSSIPTYRELCQELWTLQFPNEKYEDDNSLQDLFDIAINRHRSELVNRLTALFTVDSKSIPSYYKTIYSMPWSCVYTLNIDDLELAATRAFNLPRPAVSTSCTNFESRPRSTHTNQGLEVFHLNGCLGDIPDHVTFSTSQYAERLTAVDPFYKKLVADLMVRPVVFIGSTLDEAPLWQHIELRHHKGGREQRELRPRSYLVTPQISRARATLLSSYNTVWLQMSAEEFVDRVLNKIEADAKAGLDFLSEQAKHQSSLQKSISTVDSRSTDPFKKTEYLFGQEPDWSDIHAGRAIKRKIDESISDKIDETFAVEGLRGALIISGTAGSGKSTSLMRTALSLSAKGKKVGWIDSYTSMTPRQVCLDMQSNSSPEILAINDASMYGNELSPMINEIARLESRPILLLEVRSGVKNKVINAAQLRDVPIYEIFMSPLEDQDIDSLITVLDRENRLGVLKGMSHSERIVTFKEQAHRQLLVAMYQATTGLKFKDKMKEELLELDVDARIIYGLFAVATAYLFNLSTEDIVIAVGKKTNKSLNIVKNLYNNKLIVDTKNYGRYRTRHRVIAEIVRDELQNRGELFEILHGLISIGLSKTGLDTKRRGRPYQLIRTFLNHDRLFKLLDTEQARNLYGSFESALHWDYHYWLQRGSLEVEEGDLNLAENFLSQARSLASNNAYVDNEWAYFLFKKANMFSGSAEAVQLVDEATSILQGLMKDGRFQSEYSYHVYGSQGLVWAYKGIRDEEKRALYLRELLTAIRNGLHNFPHSTKLKQLESKLKERMLKLAVPTSSYS